jgi:TonB family protein
MRVTLPSAISGLVHTLGLGALGMWAFEATRVEVHVAPGVAITARFAPEGERPVEDFVLLDVVEIERELEPLELEPQAVEVEQERVETQVAERLELHVVPVTVIRQQMVPNRSEEEPDELPPAALRRRTVAAPPTTEAPAVPLEFQTAAIAGAVDQPARPGYAPSPGYPGDALRAGIFERIVRVRAQVTAEGLVAAVVVERSSGWPSLDEEALRTIRLWRFHPAIRNGMRVEFEYRHEFEFGRRG